GSEEDADLIRILKSEAAEYYEHLTDAFPEYAPAWYYLGYVYLNEGQYLKAQLAWGYAWLRPAARPLPTLLGNRAFIK
ncbi:MAG: tetratricopeptide repeat protein, partial [Victivallales bacterium]|nr:tetratricopeptide repeat protein [Victivallales bacterium]